MEATAIARFQHETPLFTAVPETLKTAEKYVGNHMDSQHKTVSFSHFGLPLTSLGVDDNDCRWTVARRTWRKVPCRGDFTAPAPELR